MKKSTLPILIAATAVLAGMALIGVFLFAERPAPAENEAPAANEASPAPAPPAPSEPQKGAFGTEATLVVGASVRYPDGLIAKLEKIDDSRCPPDVQCIWQGEIAATLRLEGGDVGASTQLVLGTVRAPESSLAGYSFALLHGEETSIGLVVTKPGVQVSMDDMIRVTSPRKDQLVSSPLSITGEARGTWYFEASFPVKLLDANGKVLATAAAQAQGDWMTKDFVPFKAVLEFPAPATATGTLVLEKDNPSGLPENAASVSVAVRFTAEVGGAASCRRTGCSGELCSDKDVASTCVFKPEYACYRDAVCERQATGACGWTPSPALQRCLANPPQ
ncbi:MAG TPA: Gmad2 immunoglobulin-like domain-containing protein [Candidatus Eisenbacteria bacterium]|nr:Gmad2 immunoglobulin-like domain-containing protein [Candidatus Eisenbacteria bacterium]